MFENITQALGRYGALLQRSQAFMQNTNIPLFYFVNGSTWCTNLSENDSSWLLNLKQVVEYRKATTMHVAVARCIADEAWERELDCLHSVACNDISQYSPFWIQIVKLLAENLNQEHGIILQGLKKKIPTVASTMSDCLTEYMEDVIKGDQILCCLGSTKNVKFQVLGRVYHTALSLMRVENIVIYSHEPFGTCCDKEVVSVDAQVVACTVHVHQNGILQMLFLFFCLQYESNTGSGVEELLLLITAFVYYYITTASNHDGVTMIRLTMEHLHEFYKEFDMSISVVTEYLSKHNLEIKLDKDLLDLGKHPMRFRPKNVATLLECISPLVNVTLKSNGMYSFYTLCDKNFLENGLGKFYVDALRNRVFDLDELSTMSKDYVHLKYDK